jgi:spermidine synthase
VDDGRRWLQANPDRRFDLVVQNTTWHWRAHITNLLSVEYMELVKAHLNPGGIFHYNTTDSLHAQRTGCAVFGQGLRFINFMSVSTQPVRLDRARWREALLAWAIDGKKVFDLEAERDRQRLEEVLGFNNTEGCAAIMARTEGHPLVTDDNMVVEWARPPKLRE